MRFQVTAIAYACATLLSGCGGGGGGAAGGDGGAVQSISFSFPGGTTLAVPPAVATTTLKATASSGGPVTFSSNSPDVCSVSGTTLSLLKAGECSVTATQSGFEGYGTVSQKQLFIVPKAPQTLIFRNPGAHALDATPVTLSGSTSANRPVTFSTTTPAVCTVSGTTLSKLANGLCTVVGTQDGGDIYESPTVKRNIPIGTEMAPSLTFLSGYKDGDTTTELGGVGHKGNWWWCDGCDKSLSSDNKTLNFTSMTTDPAKAKFWIHTAGLKANDVDKYALVQDGNTPSGVRVDAQAALRFNLAQNPEWFGSGANGVNIELILGHFKFQGSAPCNVRLKATLTPTAAAATSYAVALKSFTVSESCGLSVLDPWYELQDYPISVIEFSVAAPSATQAKFSLAGPVTFQ